MIYTSSNNVRHSVTKTFTILHYTSLHLSTLHLLSCKLHPTTLHYRLIWLNPLNFLLLHVTLRSFRVTITAVKNK